MHSLHLNVKIAGEVTEEQLARMYVELHAEVNKFLLRIPVKAVPSPVILQVK